MCGPTDPALVQSPPRLQRPSRSCLAHKALSALARNLDQLSPTAHRHRAQRGVRVHRGRATPDLAPGERGAGLPSVGGVGFGFLSVSRPISALQGEISPITVSRP